MCRSSFLRCFFLRSLHVGLFLAGLTAGCSSSSSDVSSSGSDGGPGPSPTNDGGPLPPVPERDTDTELVIAVDAEDFRSQGLQIGQLEIIAKVEGVEAAHETLLAASGPLFPHELRIHPPKDKPEAAVTIEVIARDRPDVTMPPIVTRLATTKFVSRRSKLAYVFLEIRCNTFPLLGGGGPSGPTCAAPTTCVSGRCVSAELPALTEYRADWANNPPSACGTGAPELTLGQGESTLAPLAENETITLEEGPQCGHHMWLSLRMKNLAQSGTITTFTATQPGTAVVVPATAFPYAWGPSEGGACDLVGLRFQLDASGTQASEFLGKPLDLKVEAKDKAGKTATTTRRVNIATEMKLIPGRNCGSGPSG